MTTIVDGTAGVTFPAGGVGNPAGAVVGTTDTQTLTNKTLTGAVMNGTVGATTPAAGTFTSLSDSGNLTFTGTGNRITGDFTNATLANRVAFQTSSANTATTVLVLPSGSGTTASWDAYNNSDPTNSSYLGLAGLSTETRLSSTIRGTGTYLPMTFYTGGGERVRIDTSGQLILNRTAAVNSATLVCSATQNTRAVSFVNNNNNNEVGYIFLNNDGTTTQYATTSDYRLKENVTPMLGALSVVAQLKPVTYKWKINGADGQGFIAHELQAVVPDCVTGEKDGVEIYTDVDGNEQTIPKHQGIDTSFLVATLTAAIQELKAIIDTQATRIAALEAK